jgi:hypothetical protein
MKAWLASLSDAQLLLYSAGCLCLIGYSIVGFIRALS